MPHQNALPDDQLRLSDSTPLPPGLAMSTHELLEMASLDALGLLDEDEREAFEAAFRAAPPALQAQIRREQARMARADILLPDVEQPLGLRARVLAAVRDAMEVMAVRRQTGARMALPVMGSSRGVSPLWRIATVGSLAAAVVFGATFFHIRMQFDDVNRVMASNQLWDQWTREFGSRFEQMLFDSRTEFVQFTPVSLDVSPAHAGRAVLLIDGESRAGHLFVKDLPTEPGEYSLVVVDENGNVAEAILQFRSVGGRANERIPNIAVTPGHSLALVAHSPRTQSTNQVLRSTSL